MNKRQVGLGALALVVALVAVGGFAVKVAYDAWKYEHTWRSETHIVGTGEVIEGLSEVVDPEAPGAPVVYLTFLYERDCEVCQVGLAFLQELFGYLEEYYPGATVIVVGNLDDELSDADLKKIIEVNELSDLVFVTGLDEIVTDFEATYPGQAIPTGRLYAAFRIGTEWYGAGSIQADPELPGGYDMERLVAATFNLIQFAQFKNAELEYSQKNGG